MYHAWAFALSIVFCLVLLIEAGCKEDSMNCGDQSNRYAIHPYPGNLSSTVMMILKINLMAHPHYELCNFCNTIRNTFILCNCPFSGK